MYRRNVRNGAVIKDQNLVKDDTSMNVLLKAVSEVKEHRRHAECNVYTFGDIVSNCVGVAQK